MATNKASQPSARDTKADEVASRPSWSDATQATTAATDAPSTPKKSGWSCGACTYERTNSVFRRGGAIAALWSDREFLDNFCTFCRPKLRFETEL